MSVLANKTLLITGGTGSFGNAVLNRSFLLSHIIAHPTNNHIYTAYKILTTPTKCGIKLIELLDNDGASNVNTAFSESCWC